MKPFILVVDDDDEICSRIKPVLPLEYQISLARDRAGALNRYRRDHPLVTLLGLELPPCPNSCAEGMATLEGIKQFDSGARVIAITGIHEKENALRAIGAGAYDILSKPVDLDELRVLVQRASSVVELEREFAQEQELGSKSNLFEGMLGNCEAMKKAFAIVDKVAPSRAPVLILGEKGTGKEMLTRAIHRRGPRKHQPFVSLNCGAIPVEQIENELFGHPPSRRKGLIELAAGGTLFLDEVGELPPNQQVNLLHFLQEKSIRGARGTEKEFDTRIVAATRASLLPATKKKEFREDLYFQLAVVTCELPPLRERGADIQSIAQFFLKRYEADNGLSDLIFTPEAIGAIACHSWPGNVRELQNHIQRAVVMADSHRIELDDLALGETASANESGLIETKFSSLNLKAAKMKLERTLVSQALLKHRGKITAAASDLGISRPTFYDLMNRHGISKSSDCL